VTVSLDSGAKIWGVVHTGSSYASQSELPLTFGLGAATKVAKVEVAWPSGGVDSATNVAARQTIMVREGKGVLPSTPGPKAAGQSPAR
jgi:hypothetical protein